MKHFKFITYTILTSAIMLSGCQDDLETEDVSNVTFFPNFTVKGQESVFVTSNTSYKDPGVTVTENGKALDVSTAINGRYFGFSGTTLPDPLPADLYTIKYSATNSDGFEGSTSRTLFVSGNGDLTTSIEGLYTSTTSIGDEKFEGLKYIIIKKNNDGTYSISDAAGGFYEYGRGDTGDAFVARGATITANDISTNDFSFSTGVPLRGGSIAITSFTVNPTAATIEYTADWSVAGFNFTFIVALTKVNSPS